MPHSPSSSSRAVPLRSPASARLLLLVVAGGAAGTALRAWLESWLGPTAIWPATTLAINLVGSFLLGALVRFLAATGPDAGRHRAARLGLGTGLCGGLTTYSTFAVETVSLIRVGQTGMAAAYAVGTVLGGLLAAFLGWAIGTRLARLWSIRVHVEEPVGDKR